MFFIKTLILLFIFQLALFGKVSFLQHLVIVCHEKNIFSMNPNLNTESSRKSIRRKGKLESGYKRHHFDLSSVRLQ